MLTRSLHAYGITCVSLWPSLCLQNIRGHRAADTRHPALCADLAATTRSRSARRLSLDAAAETSERGRGSKWPDMCALIDHLINADLQLQYGAKARSCMY